MHSIRDVRGVKSVVTCVKFSSSIIQYEQFNDINFIKLAILSITQ